MPSREKRLSDWTCIEFSSKLCVLGFHHAVTYRCKVAWSDASMTLPNTFRHPGGGHSLILGHVRPSVSLKAAQAPLVLAASFRPAGHHAGLPSIPSALELELTTADGPDLAPAAAFVGVVRSAGAVLPDAATLAAFARSASSPALGMDPGTLDGALLVAVP